MFSLRIKIKPRATKTNNVALILIKIFLLLCFSFRKLLFPWHHARGPLLHDSFFFLCHIFFIVWLRHCKGDNLCIWSRRADLAPHGWAACLRNIRHTCPVRHSIEWSLNVFLASYCKSGSKGTHSYQWYWLFFFTTTALGWILTKPVRHHSL